jgi:hypothetical protein
MARDTSSKIHVDIVCLPSPSKPCLSACHLSKINLLTCHMIAPFSLLNPRLTSDSWANLACLCYHSLRLTFLPQMSSLRLQTLVIFGASLTFMPCSFMYKTHLEEAFPAVHNGFLSPRFVDLPKLTALAETVSKVWISIKGRGNHEAVISVDDMTLCPHLYIAARKFCGATARRARNLVPALIIQLSGYGLGKTS